MDQTLHRDFYFFNETFRREQEKTATDEHGNARIAPQPERFPSPH